MGMDFWDPFRARLAFEDGDGSYVVRVDLRGLAVDELRVRVHDDTITVSGASSADGEQRPFCRTVRLPAPVRADEIDARQEDGVLSLTLPVAGALRTNRMKVPAQARPRRSDDRRVLVVDDDEDMRRSLSMALSEAGYEVVTAPHGAAALGAINQAAPKAILLDMRMPVMDGWEFSRAYRQRPGPHAPIIAVTGARDVAERAATIQADGYLAKPFDLDRMLAIVGQHAPAS